MQLVAETAALSRGSIPWETAMDMPIPELREAHRRLSRIWSKMTF